MRHFLRIVTTATLALGLLCGSTVLLATPAHAKIWAVPPADPDADPAKNLEEFENRILLKINKLRARKGLRQVRVFESCVDGYAEGWAKRIKQTGDFVHRDQSQILNGCDVMWAGETLVRGEGLTPRVAVRAWMNSTPHRKVLMKKRAQWAGIGVRVDAQDRVVAVLNFADRT